MGIVDELDVILFQDIQLPEAFDEIRSDEENEVIPIQDVEPPEEDDFFGMVHPNVLMPPRERFLSEEHDLSHELTDLSQLIDSYRGASPPWLEHENGEFVDTPPTLDED